MPGESPWSAGFTVACPILGKSSVGEEELCPPPSRFCGEKMKVGDEGVQDNI